MSEHRVVESVTVEIEVPAEFAWAVLIDFPRYPEWNPYTVHVATTLEVGTPIDLTVPTMDGSAETFVSREYIRSVDPPHHLRYDTGDEIPGVVAVRDQWIEPLGQHRCSYRTANDFSGRYAESLMKRVGPWVKAGFDDVARALKVRAERLWRKQIAQ